MSDLHTHALKRNPYKDRAESGGLAIGKSLELDSSSLSSKDDKPQCASSLSSNIHYEMAK